MERPPILYHIPCPACGTGAPVELVMASPFHPTHPEHWLLRPQTVPLTCPNSGCGETFTVERDATGTTRYVTHPNAGETAGAGERKEHGDG